MPDDNLPRRFMDDELHEFYEEFKKHKEHEAHDRKSRANDREQLLQCMNENKEAVEALTVSTKGLVDAWDAAGGALKVTAALGSVVKWGVGVGGPIYGLYLFIKHSGKVG